jgi:hypothetical protein
MDMDDLTLIHRSRHNRVQRPHPPSTKVSKDFSDPQFPELERKALQELAQAPPGADYQLIFARNQLSPLVMMHKWGKLLKQFNPRHLIAMIDVIKEKYNEGLGLTDIGRVVGIRRTSVRNILKGHIVNIDRIQEHIGKRGLCIKEFEFVHAFDISLCSVREQDQAPAKQNSVVLDFELFRNNQVRKWMNDEGLLVPRALQLSILRSVALGKSVQAACQAFKVMEGKFTRLWGELLSRFSAAKLEAGVKIAAQLLLLGYTFNTISDRMECADRIIKTIAANLEALADVLNMPITMLHCMRMRFAKVQEMTTVAKERNAWWLYQNGLDVAMISSWLGLPFDVMLNGKIE